MPAGGDEAHGTGETLASPGATRPSGGGDERLAEGARAGEYVIEAHVGAGAMGDVYRAQHPVIGKRVAIKVIKRRLADSAEALERFVREARAVNKIDHPHVVDVFAMGQLDDGRLWLAMNYLEGESLGKRLRREGPVSEAELPVILRPVCEALAAAHGQGVIHRDLKADNIFLARPAGTGGSAAAGGTGTGAARVYVLDFGIAKVLADVAAETGGAPLTAEGAWVGTPAYMAPEQWTGEAVSARSDVYALGIVAYEMLAGRPPYTGSSLPAIMEQHFRAEPPPLSTATGGLRVPEALEATIRRALAKKPEDRPASAMELLLEIEAALGVTGGGAAARAAGAGVTVHGRGGAAGARVGRSWLLVAGGAVGAGALALALALAFGGRERERRAAPDIGGAVGGQAAVSITSVPPGVEVVQAGAVIGKTPTNWRAAAGEKAALDFRKPGYRPAHRDVEVVPELALDVRLEPIEAYEGVWRIPGGHLRRFEFSGDYIEGFVPAQTADPRPAFLRRFEYVRQEGEVLTFAASEPHVHAEAPAEPSCRFPLATEYRYNPGIDRLEQRRQRVEYELRGGRCVARPGGTLEPVWTAWEPCERLARGGGPAVAESAAGAGVPVGNEASLVNAISPGPQAQELDAKTPDKGKGPDSRLDELNKAAPAPDGAKPDQQNPKQNLKKNPKSRAPAQKVAPQPKAALDPGAKNTEKPDPALEQRYLDQQAKDGNAERANPPTQAAPQQQLAPEPAAQGAAPQKQAPSKPAPGKSPKAAN